MLTSLRCVTVYREMRGGVAVHARGSLSTAPLSASPRSPQLSKYFLIFCGRAATYTTGLVVMFDLDRQILRQVRGSSLEESFEKSQTILLLDHIKLIFTAIILQITCLLCLIMGRPHPVIFCLD